MRESAQLRESARLRAVQAPIIPIVGRLIAETPGTISLGQGIVSYGPPPEAIQAIESFAGDLENHRYGPVEGMPALIEAIEAKLAAENGIHVRPARRVVVTAGANMGFMNAVLAVADPGDEVVLQAPFYFNHEMAIVMAGCRAVAVPTDASYQIEVDAIRRAMTPRTRAVVTISPNNPTGAVYPEASLREVNAICRERGVYHIHDEAYEYFTYEGARHFSPGCIEGAAAHTISLYSLSKAYGFASWRIGYMVIPDPLFDAVNKIQDTILICPTAIAQVAAIGALARGASYCRGFLDDLAHVRENVLEQFGRIAGLCTVPRPGGAFYCFVRIHAAMDPMTLVERLIREHRVAVIPGTTFGRSDACYLRVSYGALEAHTVAEGMSRLVQGLREIAGRGQGDCRLQD
jgi:aspartate/methionine/tyrosine aminotransferase